MPVCVQRRRTAGWSAPLDSQGRRPKYVGRGSRYGNTFTVADCLESAFASTTEEAREVCVAMFREWLSGEMPISPEGTGTSWSRERRDWIREHAADLAGRDLMCWCPEDQPCHADVLLELANPTVKES